MKPEDLYPHEVDADWVRSVTKESMEKSVRQTMYLFEEISQVQSEPKSPERDYKLRLLKYLLNVMY